jgi:hypothetical protein
MPRMQVIAASAPVTRASRLALVRSALVASLLLFVGALLAWVCLATPVIVSLVPSGRPTALQMGVGIVAWGFAIVVPAGFVIIGIARIAGTIEGLVDLRPRTVTPRLARALGPDHLAATDLILPSGRRIHELVLGPFGIVVLGDVPPPAVSRHAGTQWEIRGHRGRWVPMEAPLDRAERDAERVRGWLTEDDRDFLVKVYAAIVTDDPRVERSPQCAVVRTRELGDWLAALPPQRGLTGDRRERIVALIRSVARAR